MRVCKSVIINCILLLFSLSFYSSTALSSPYDTFSNLTHTCKVRPQIVCVDVMPVVNKTCVDPTCLINSGGNYTTCISNLITSNLTMANLTHLNNKTGVNGTSSNNTMNTTIATCNATWIYPTNKSLCLNSTSWSKTICLLHNVTCTVNSTQCTLNPVFYIGGFFNLKDLDGWGNLPAAQLAVNQINDDPKYLSNITLSLTAKQSTQALLSHGTELLYTYLHSGPPKLMLLLPQESDLSRTVAAYAGLKRWGTLQFSYGTTDNSLASNKKLFPRFFRLNTLAISYNRLRATFVARYPQWKYDVGLLYFANTYYEEVNADLLERLKSKGINVVANVGFRSSPEEALALLKEKKAHVILATFPYTYGKKLFCKAFKLQMFGPHYVWITFTLMPFKFWIPKPSDNLECSEYEMTCTVENHFSFYGASVFKTTSHLINKPNVTFSKTYNNLVDVGNFTKNRSSLAPYAYDAIWTMENILERARSTVEGKGKVLTELNYDDVNETKLFEKLAYETDFNGVTGRVRFFENGNRKFSMYLLQVRSNGVGYIVGNYDVDKDTYSPSGIKWRGGIPYERTIKTYEWRYIELVLFVFWCIFAILGICYGVLCLIFIIKYRYERSIKYSSPTINVFIIIGCLLNFVTVILYGVDYQRANESRLNVLCKVRLWIFSFGFTLCIGGLWVKVWTLYQILIERRVYSKIIMEYWMFGIVVVFVLIDVIYLAIWTTTDGLYRTIEMVQDQPEYQCFQTMSSNPFRSTIIYIETCDCDKLSLWLGIFLTYKALVLLCGFYMSWKIRHVYTRKLVDAQYSAKLLILAVPFCLLGLIFALTLRLHPTPHYGLVGIIIIIYTFIVLGFLYGHKIINIFHRPRNRIKVLSKDVESGKKCSCCPLIFSSCLASFCCCCCFVCSTCMCCKALWDALLHGPRKNRGSFVKELSDDKMDYQIGNMPGDKERQIIILKQELEKREQELVMLKRHQRVTQAVKQTQTPGFFNGNVSHEGSSTCSSDRSNESLDDDSTGKHRLGKPHYNRFKVYHRKLDFSHVGSRVDSGLEGKFLKRDVAEIPENGRSSQNRQNSRDSEILALQKSLLEREKELSQLKAYLGIAPSLSIGTSSKVGSLASIGEEYSIPNGDASDLPEADAPDRSINSVIIAVHPGDSEASPDDGQKSYKPRPGGVEIFNTSTDYSHVKSRLALGSNENSSALPNEVDTQPQEPGKSQDQEFDDKSRGKSENFDGGTNEEQANESSQKRRNTKILNSPDDYSHVQSRLHVSQFNNSGGQNSQRFKKKVGQLSSISMLKTNHSSVATRATPSPRPGGQIMDDNKIENSENIPAEGNEQSSKDVRSSVKIFNASSDYSRVKSRLFDSGSNNQNGAQSSNGTDTAQKSTNARRGSKVDNDEEFDKSGDEQDQDSKETDNQYSKNQSNVKILNVPTDYSHVKSRLFDSSASNDGKSPNTRRRSKAEDNKELDKNVLSVGDEQDQTKENNQYSKNKSDVKIFNAPSDYSHVRSRLYDSSNTSTTPETQNNRRFQRKVQQLHSFGVLKHNSSNTSNKTVVSDKPDDKKEESNL